MTFKWMASPLCDGLGWGTAVVLAMMLVSTGREGYAQGVAIQQVVVAEAAPDPAATDSPTADKANDLPDSPVPSSSAANWVDDSVDGESPVQAPGGTARQGLVSSNFLQDGKKSTTERTLTAPTYHRYIRPDQIAVTLTPRQRLIFGFHQPLSPFFLLTVAAAAGYEQAVNGSPNYGSNFTAYGQRLGAAAIRNAAQSIFSDSLMAPLLHEDPRYYIMGNRHNVALRAAYAMSRVAVSRKDDGGATPNYALLSGYAEAAALNNAFYPAVNVGLGQTGRSFVGSLLGVGVGNIVREFLPGILEAARLRRFE